MNGQVAIVTGGGGNIGVGVCRALAKAGATVVALDLDPSAAGAAKKGIVCDVTDPGACASAVDEVVGEFGGVDTLVNLAQKFRIDIPVMELTDDDMRVSFETGPTATLRMMQLCYPHIKARGGGAVVNFASGVGTQGMPGAAAYAAAKEAIRGLTKTAALEWALDNVRVNAICPLSSGDPANTSWAPDAIATNPMRRLGDPEIDIGGAVVYLATAGYVTGRTLQVDGGVGCWR